MKTKTKLTILLIIIAAALLVVDYYVLRAEDESAPVISFPEGEATYSADMDDEDLLEGVTARDDKDGDVSDSLRIGEKVESEDGTYITIFYIARDSSNNIAQSSRIMQMDASAQAQIQQSATPTPVEEETTGTADTTQSAEGVQDTQQTANGTESEAEPELDEQGRLENEAAIAALPATSPRIYLSQYAVEIAAGSEFEPLSYVEDIQDDADSRDDLYLGIQISGEVNTSVAGTYELYYYVNDSAGNTSNEAKLTVTVA